MALLVRDVIKSFGQPETRVLKGISFEAGDGELIAITGRSGSGKSTLLYIISTLDVPTAGSVEIDGHNVTAMNRVQIHEFRNAHMGFVFQFHHLFPELTALENVLMPARKTQSHEARREFALQLLSDFDIGDKAHRFPRELSGGEQQRVAIARALVMKPKFLFADEPTGNLDTTNGEVVMRHFERVNRTLKTTIIYVTHDREFANRAGRVISLTDGQVSSDSRHSMPR